MANENINAGGVEAAVAEKGAPLDMSATVRLIEPVKNLLGFANVTFNNAVTFTDFKVLKDAEGNLFVGMPSKPDKSSKTGYSATVRFSDDDAKAQLKDTVLTAYDTAVEKLKARAAAIDADKPPRIADQVEKAGKEAAKHNAERAAPPKGKDKSAEH